MKKKLPVILSAALLSITSCSKGPGYNIFPLNPNSKNVSTLAGSGGQGNANGTGTNASFFDPTGVAVDTSGNVYVADFRNSLIREISPSGVVTTLAGTGTQGNVNGAPTVATFYLPTGIALDASGNVYVADSYNNLIREISPSGMVSTFAGTGAQGAANGMASAATFNYPQGVAVDGFGNVYVADYGNNVIREVSAAGMVTTLAGNSNPGNTNGVDTAATFNQPTGVAVDASGNVYVADFGNDLIRKISKSGMVTTLAGSGAAGSANGTGAAASFNGTTGVAVDAAGNVYVADYSNNAIREISPTGAVTTLGSGTGASFKKYIFTNPYGVAVDAAGNIYVAAYGSSTIQKITR